MTNPTLKPGQGRDNISALPLIIPLVSGIIFLIYLLTGMLK